MSRRVLAALVAALALGVSGTPAVAATYGGITYDADLPFTTQGRFYADAFYSGTATTTGYMTTHIMRKNVNTGVWSALGTSQVTLIRGVYYNAFQQPYFACSVGSLYTVRTQSRFASGAWDISPSAQIACRW